MNNNFQALTPLRNAPSFPLLTHNMGLMLTDATMADAGHRPANVLTLAWLYPSCPQMSPDISFETEEHYKLADVSGAEPKGMCQPLIALPSRSAC